MVEKHQQFKTHFPHTKKEKALVAGGFVGLFVAAVAVRGLLHHEDAAELGPESDPVLQDIQQKASFLLRTAKKPDQRHFDNNRMAALFAVRSHLTLPEVRQLFVPKRTPEHFRTVSRTLIALTTHGFIEYKKSAPGQEQYLAPNEPVYAYIQQHTEAFPDFQASKVAWQESLGAPEANGSS